MVVDVDVDVEVSFCYDFFFLFFLAVVISGGAKISLKGDGGKIKMKY